MESKDMESGCAMMGKDECWNTFMTSGKVTDYLKMKQAEQTEQEDVPEKSETQGETECRILLK